jgi:hypothetical protein
VVNVHRSGDAVNSLQSSGMDTIAPGRARGEYTHIDVFVRLFRR